MLQRPWVDRSLIGEGVVAAALLSSRGGNITVRASSMVRRGDWAGASRSMRRSALAGISVHGH